MFILRPVDIAAGIYICELADFSHFGTNKPSIKTIVYMTMSFIVLILFQIPANIANDNIIQFRVVRDAQGRKLEVTSANLLVKVKYRRKKANGKRRKLNKRRKVSIILSTVTEAGKRNQTIAAIKNVKIRKTTWFKLKLPELFIQKILDSEQQLIRLHIKCKGCKKGVKLVLVRGSRRRRKSFRKRPRRKQRGLSRTRPFLILHTKLKTYLRSKRRVRNCGNNETSACCKMNIVFNFAEFGWDDWILSPAQFTTGVCKGECTRRRRNSRSDPEEDENSRNRTSLTRTCKPTKQKPLRIIYQMDDHTIIRSALPNMITTRCGCRT